MNLQNCTPLLNVGSIERSLGFWRDLVGFEVVAQFEEAGVLRWVRLRSGGVGLMLNAPDKVLGEARVVPGSYTDAVLYFGVPSLVIHGWHDPIPSDSSYFAARALAARYVVLEASGHAPPKASTRLIPRPRTMASRKCCCATRMATRSPSPAPRRASRKRKLPRSLSERSSHVSRYRRCEAGPREVGLVFLRRDDLTALVHAGLQIDVVRALQFAGFLVFDEGIGAERVVRAPHVAPRRGYFAFRNGHGRISQAWKIETAAERPAADVSAGVCPKARLVSSACDTVRDRGVLNPRPGGSAPWPRR